MRTGEAVGAANVGLVSTEHQPFRMSGLVFHFEQAVSPRFDDDLKIVEGRKRKISGLPSLFANLVKR